MVFESLVASLLNKFLGDYVQNFDSSQLKLGIWGGDVTLKHLDVKESALDDLDLPIKVLSGHLGKLILKIPYKNIYTSPTIATIEGLFIVVIPNTGIKYDAEKEAKAAEAAKRAELQKLEETKSKLSEKDTKDDKKDTFTEKLVTQIIKNLQVKIKDIHLRYEDNFSDSKKPFSVGFTLHNLSFETTDEKWIPAIIQENVNIIHKLVVLDSLSVYWNSKSELLHKFNASDREVAMEKMIATSTFIPDDVKYILGPINSKAQLRLNSKPESDGSGFKIPKVWLNVVMEEIAVGLSRLQYQDLIKLLESLDRMTIATLYRKYRPNGEKPACAKEWWKFALTAVLEEDVRRKQKNWSWDHMKRHLDYCKKYKELYVLKLQGKKFSTEMTNQINEYERDLDLFNITIVRKQAELEVLRSAKKEVKQTWGGWFGSFFSKEQNLENADESTGKKIAKQIEEAMTPEEKQKLYEAIGYHEQPVVTEYPIEFVENKLLFLLHNLTVILSDDTRSEPQVLKANLKEVSASVEQRSAAQALRSAKKEVKQTWGGWFGSFFSKEQNLENADESTGKKIAKQIEEAMTPEEKQKLYEAIGYHEQPVVTEYPIEFVENKLLFLLHNLTVILSDDTRSEPQVLKANLKEVSASVEQRSAAQALSFDAKVDSFIVKGVPSGKSVPTIVSSRQFVENNQPLLNIFFETNPLDESCDQRLHLYTQPLEITYDAVTVNNLAEVFKPPEKAALQQLQATAMLKLEDLKEMSAFGLQYAIEQHKYLDLKVDAQPLFIVIPENGVLKENSSLIVISLGNFKMDSHKRDPTSPTVSSLVRAGSTDDEVLSTMIDKAYDKFDISVRNVEILLTESGDDWKDFIGKLDDSHHLLYPLTISIDFHQSIVTIDPRLPKMKIVGVLPSLEIVVSDKQIFNLVKISTSIPLPESEPSVEVIPGPIVSSAAVAAEFVNVKVVRDIKKEAVKNIKDLSSEAEEDMTIEQKKALPIQSTSLDLKFEIHEFSFAISRAKEERDVNLLKFAFHNFGAGLVMRTFDMIADIYLGGIILDHSEFSTPKGEPLKIISSVTKGSDEHLFTLKYLSVNKKAPDFETLHESTLQTISANFRSIDFILHQEAILSLMDLTNSILSNVQPISKKPEPTEATNEISTFKKRTSSEEKSAHKSTSKKKIESQIIDLKLNAALESIRLIICNKKYDLTDIRIKGMNTSVIMQKSKTSVFASLKDVIVSDPSEGALYPQIITTTAGEVLDVKFIMFNNATEDENYFDMSAVDMSVNVSFGRMKIVFLNKFVSSLLLFLDHFQVAKDKVAEASAVAAEIAKQNMEEVYEKSVRILLNIVIEAPVIITPQNSSSDNAIVADLGVLKILNKFSLGEKRNELGMPAIFEKMCLHLTNLQLFRAIVKPDTGDVTAECLILDPVSFSLDITRNHSFGWHTEQPEIHITGELAAVKITLSQDDYYTIMSVLNENLTETDTERQSTAIPVVTEPVDSKTQITTVAHPSEKSVIVSEVAVKVHRRFKFNFVLRSVLVTLCHGDTPLTVGVCERKGSCSMAEVEVKVLEAHAEMMTDSSMLAQVFLTDVHLDDTRKTRKSGITRLMQRLASDTSNNMIHIEFNQNSSGDKRVQTTVSSFSFVFCLDYVMMLQEFFAGSSAIPTNQTDVNSKQTMTTTTHSISDDSLSQATGSTVIFLKVQKPDIVLVENIEDEDSNAIFLNNEIDLRVTMSGSSQAITGSIKNLTFYTACFNCDKRHETSAKILSPCDIDIQCNFREHSQHMDVMFRDLILHISPGTVHLLTNILSSIVSEPVVEDSEIKIEKEDYSNIWNEKALKENKYWFLETVTAKDALTEEKEESICPIPTTVHQQMLFTMRKVVITIEAGVGTRTIPMLLMESSFQADIRDWASNIYIGSSFSLEMSYYNEKIAVWEPVIEPIETTKGHRSWELMMEISKEHDALELSPEEEEPDEIVFEPPQMSLHIVAQDVLELTVSKTCLDVLTNLGQAFQEAVNKAVGKKPPVPYAPFHVNNYLGVPITIILSNGIFQILDENKDYSCVKLESGCPPLHLTYAASSNSSSNRLSILKKQDAKEETYFNIMINEDDMTVERRISVACTDKRFFQLPRVTYPGNRWGFVISILSLYGSKFITFHSILLVHNHFSVPIDIYFMKPSLNELEWCCCAEPNKTEYIPLHAVYTSTSELFFKPKHLDNSYTLSLPPFVWRDLTDDPSTQKIIHCKDKKNVGKPFYISVAGEAERIYYEETSRKTMASSLYKLNLNPTAVLRNLLLFPINYSMQGIDEDYKLAEGESNDLWAVDLEKIGIEIRINNYLDRNWTCYKVLKKEMDELSIWVFESVCSDKTLYLELGMHTQKIKGCHVMQLYSPFCMVNKTGLQLTYRGEDDNIIHHPPDINPVLFSFKAKAFFAKKKAALRIADSEWSDKFSLDAVGSSGTVIAKAKEGRTYGIGVQIKLSQAGLTKLVIFTPYYLLVNNSEKEMEVMEVNSSEGWIKIPSNECIRFWPKDTTKAEMVARYVGEEEQTMPFSFKEIHHTLLSLKTKEGGIMVDCQVNQSSVIITFEDYIPGHAAALLVNNLEDLPLVFNQSNVSNEVKVSPQSCLLYAWQNPLENRLLCWKCEDTNGEHDLVKDGIGEITLKENFKVYWVSFLDGMQRVLLFTDDLALATAAQEAGELERIEQEVTISLQGVGVSLVNNDTKAEILYVGMTSTGVIWESRKKKNKRYKPLSVKELEIIETAYQRYHNEIKVGRKTKPVVQLNGRIEVDFENMMMLKPVVRCLRRTYVYGFWLQYKTSPHQLQVHARINRLQIDNQLMDCVFPVVLAPVAPPKSVAAETEPKPFTELSVMLRKAEHSAVPQFKYCKILIQEFHIKLDQGFINSVLLFFTADEPQEIDHVKILALDKASANSTLRDVAAVYSSQEKQNYFDNLHFSPLKVHISFSMTGGSNESNKPTPIHSDFLNLLLQSVGVTLTEIQDVIFKLDYFERRYVFMSHNQLIAEATSHYVSQAVKQLYMLVLGLDVIGNPVGLLLGLGEGVTDLFYEPFQGAIQGPEEFAEGLALGVKSLFGHAIGGAAGAASRITGTLGKGIAALTLDKDYQKKRRQNISRRPQDFTHGIAESGKGLVMGVFDGVTGIVTKPIEGAREGGVGGFFKGVGKGLIGVVTRPTAGVVDFASGSLDAVKRVTQVSDEVKRLRVPRFIRPDGIVRPYVKREAEGNKLLQEVEKGKYSNTDIYLVHVAVGDDKLFLLVTNNRVMYIEKGEIFGQWNTVWEYRFEELKEPPQATEKGLRIMLQTPHRKGIFSKSVAGKLVHITDPEVCKWIADKITDAMRK
ncbi:vacuolar protein sorting-associated protein 13 [Nephila pilipes]|uniref:Vacuolar protein sorting-associated protein 13 n=1 Tax=Nephila pilipes TaxID=299642 RepID=A0A8X6U8A1_NEPPI|nr:vacuolar protein sorting-associated protein 13 [Nephila pilipes]